MIPVHAFKDKDVAVFGLGASGIATAKALAAGGARLSVFDDNPESVEAARGAGLAAADLRTIDWQATAALVLAPGVPLTHPKPHWSVDLARGAGVEIIGDIELFVRARRAAAPGVPFVAITGTNGKSTTTALISHILAEAGRDAQMGGNIGKPVLTLEPFAADRAYVVECSSYQIELAPSLDPTVGILLNLSPDHLDRHATMERYAAIKERLVAGSDLAVVSVDDPHCAAIAGRLAASGRQVMRLSVRQALRDGYFAKGRTLVHAVDGVEEVVARLDDALFLRGEHNAQNALAAVAACRALGLGNGEIQRGLESFPGLAHRMQIVARQGRTLFVNDSKATNADAAAPALASFDRIYWIAGGLPKEGGIESLRRFFPRIARAYLIGEAAPAFAATLGDEVAFEISGTLDAAVAHASRDAGTASGEGEAVVLLSPACASFDQYRNFEMRGEAFRRAVAALDGVQPIGGLAR